MSTLSSEVEAPSTSKVHSSTSLEYSKTNGQICWFKSTLGKGSLGLRKSLGIGATLHVMSVKKRGPTT